jgi:putative copper resistance protein D
MGLSIAITKVAIHRSHLPSHLLTTSLCRMVLTLLLTAAPALAQHVAPLPHDPSHAVGHDGHDRAASGEVWEGSARGIAYSERNHHIAGFLVLLMGLAELSHVLRLPSLRWARLLLPSALIFAGFFILVWSDHAAWPIGSLSLTETFAGGDSEILQHKVYGLLALGVGSVELFRRLGRIGHKAWASPLPLMAIVGGLMLFGHSHGFHPSAQKIAMHHAIMGTMAVTAGSTKLWSTWVVPAERSGSTNWEWVWVSLILLIGAQLLLYSE